MEELSALVPKSLRVENSLTLRLDLILDNKRLVLVVNLLVELGRNGVVGSDVLDDEALVALNALEDSGFLHRPFADVGPVLIRLGIFLLSVGGSPSLLPVICELFQEGSLDVGGLPSRGSAIVNIMTSSEELFTNREKRSLNNGRVGSCLVLSGMGTAHE
jgi:hypothetical protein